MFSKGSFDLGTFSSVQHSIDLVDGPPISCPTRRLPVAFEEKVNEIISDMLHNNIIRRSTSPYSAPIVVVPKKNNESRLCIDYRKLNQNTRRPIHHIPSAQEIFDRLGGNKFFSTLDLSKGYYQIQLK